MKEIAKNIKLISTYFDSANEISNIPCDYTIVDIKGIIRLATSKYNHRANTYEVMRGGELVWHTIKTHSFTVEYIALYEVCQRCFLTFEQTHELIKHFEL